MSVRRPEVLVLGAGVSGLTTALCVARAGSTVRIQSDRGPLETTSAVAGAVWGPYTMSDTRVLRWCLETWGELKHLAETHPESGVRMAFGMEAAHEATTPPEWIVELGDYTSVPDDELPAGYAAAWRYHVPVVEMHSYITFLTTELSALDVPVDVRPPARSLDDVATEADVVLNCTGLGARELVPDAGMYPVQGQLVVVDNPGIEGFFIDDPGPRSEEPTYFMSHGDHVVLGGSWVPHSDRTTADHDVGKAILARCAAIEPALATARVREHRVGLRPTRRRVRLEREDHPSRTIIHNYGHGGSGVTLSWGCAIDVRRLLVDDPAPR